jgi:hypothetical protein
LAAFVDIVATNILAIPFVVYVMLRFDLMGRRSAPGAITALIHEHPPLFVLQILIGLVCSVLGGYVAARLAKHHELLNGTLSCYLCVGIGIYSLVAGKGYGTWLVQLLLLLASPVSGLLGGYLRVATKTDSGESSSPTPSTSI